MDGEEGRRLGDELLKIKTNTGSGFLADAQRAGKTQRIIAFIAPRQSICIHQKLLPLASYCGAPRKNCHPKIRLRHCL